MPAPRPLRRPTAAGGAQLRLERRAFDELDDRRAAGVFERDEAAFFELLGKVAERAGAVIALRERRVELQQRALEQSELRRDFAIGRAP